MAFVIYNDNNNNKKVYKFVYTKTKFVQHVMVLQYQVIRRQGSVRWPGLVSPPGVNRT